MNRRILILTLFGCLFLVPQDGPAGDPSEEAQKKGPIQVEITTHLGDEQSFVEGDTIAFFLSLDTDSHIVAIYEDARKHRFQILPNRKQKDNYYQSGIFHPIPGKDAPFRFFVTEPFGTETLCVFAAQMPIADLPGELLENGLKRLHADMVTLKNQIKAQAGPTFGEYCLQIHTKQGR